MKDEAKKPIEMSPEHATDRVWELADSIHTAILITWDGQRQHARPMAATVDRDRHAIYFLTDSDAKKLDEIARFPEVSAVFSEGNKFVTFNGHGETSNDREKIRDLWNVFAKAWWDSADDPSIRLLTLTPTEAELWDGSNKLVAGAIMLTAALTGRTPFVGEHARVKV